MVKRAIVELKAVPARAFLLFAVFILSARIGCADTEVSPPSLAVDLEPAVLLPLGPGAGYFLPGTAVRIGVEYTLPSPPMLSVRAGMLCEFSPIAAGLGTTSLVGGLLGASWRVPVVGRLSALAFAGGGYALALINGDPASSASMPVVEGGIGLSWLVNPNAVLRLDGSYLYLLGANGSLSVSLGVLLRPWSNAARPVVEGRQKTGLQIEGVVLDSVYPSLCRFYDNHPVGEALIRNTGRRSVFDLSVRYQVPGIMDNPRVSAARRELKPGETWQAPLSLEFDGSAAGTPASADSEVAVTFVEGGEQRVLRRTAPLDVQASHTINPLEYQGAAAFVLPADPPLRDLADSISAAIGAPGEAHRGRSVLAAFAVREGLRLLGLRITADSTDARAQGAKGGAARPLKYPRETLRDRAGNSWDVAVLCASLLEAAGVKAALVEASGRVLVAVEAEPDGKDPVFVLDGRPWLPIDATRLDGTFHEASSDALQTWKSASESGASHLVTVRDAWERYPPSALPPVNPEPIPDGLGGALKTAVAAFSAAGGSILAAGSAPATAPAFRRLLVVFAPDPFESYPLLLRTTLADSLALALGHADPAVMAIPYGMASFPASTDERRRIARDLGADCSIVVGMSGDRSSPVITVETDDLTSNGGRGIASAARIGPIPLMEESRPQWGPVVLMVVAAFAR